VILVARDVDFALSGGHATSARRRNDRGQRALRDARVAVGALIRNQVGALIALGAWALAVETVLFVAVPSVGRHLPGLASNAFAGLPDPNHLSPAVGGAVLLAWTITLAVVAGLRTERSDIHSHTRGGTAAA
jgi:hypothetical protein